MQCLYILRFPKRKISSRIWLGYGKKRRSQKCKCDRQIIKITLKNIKLSNKSKVREFYFLTKCYYFPLILLPHITSRSNRLTWCYNNQTSVFVLCRKNHAFTDDAFQLTRLKVSNEANLLANQLFWIRIIFRNT